MFFIIVITFPNIDNLWANVFFSFVSSKEPFPGNDMKPYPDWVYAIIILLCVVPVLPIPLVALFRAIRAIMCGKKKNSNIADLNPYDNDAFEIETQEAKHRERRQSWSVFWPKKMDIQMVPQSVGNSITHRGTEQ